MPSRRVRNLDQRIADTRRDLEALEVRKRVRDDATLKWLSSVAKRLDRLTDEPGDTHELAIALGHLETHLERATRKPETALPFEEPGS